MGSLEHAGPRWPVWVVSLALHACGLGVLLSSLRPIVLRSAPSTEPLVYVAPAPPPPAPLGVPDAQPEAAPLPQLPAKEEVPTPPVVTKRLVVPTPKPVPRPRPPRAPRPAGVPRGEPQGTTDGVAGGVVGGTAGGLIGGRVGAKGSAPVPASQVAQPPVPTTRVSPEYPQMARVRGVQGVVMLRAVVDREGRVEDGISVIDSVTGLDDAAVAAFRRWRFQPGRDDDGDPVRVIVEQAIRFRLQ